MMRRPCLFSRIYMTCILARSPKCRARWQACSKLTRPCACSNLSRLRLLWYPCSGCGRASMLALPTARADGPMLLAQVLILPPEQFAASWCVTSMCAGSVVCLCGTRLFGCEATRTLSWKTSTMLPVNLTSTVLCARMYGTE